MLEESDSVRFVLEHVRDLSSENHISLIFKALDILATLTDIDMARLALKMRYSL